MSFYKFKNIIELGDTVILYLTPNQIYAIKVESKVINKKGNQVDNIFQTPFGALNCVSLVGKEFGTKISLSKGWGYVLQPTPELWTLTLPHRTQIIYTPDISMITTQLELKPGSIVIESGTGSGSLSHAIIRTIKPNGHLYTFDFHEERVSTVKKEFEEHGYSDFVTIEQRDVCSNGFTPNLKADAVFLDLPHPWLAIPHTVKCLKENGRLCSFSPCIEQVQKSCLALANCGFQEIQSLEIVQTEYNVKTKHLNRLNLDFMKIPKTAEQSSSKHEKETMRVLASILPSTQPGHTGFLTFATYPLFCMNNLNVENENNDT